jgi:hypothetical protein
LIEQGYLNLVLAICLVASHDRWVHDDAGQNSHIREAMLLMWRWFIGATPISN